MTPSQPYRVLIADDELLSRQYLAALVSQDGRFQVIATCDGGFEAVAHARSAQLDVAFLDIRMPRMDGFKTREAIRLTVPLIVFVTAYSEYAVKAYDVDAFDYVTKPLDPARFAQALDRVCKRLSEKEAATHAAASAVQIAGVPEPTDLPGRSKKLLNGVRHDLIYSDSEIESIESHGNYVNVRVRGDCCLVRESLESFCRQLNPADFVRVHRCFVVNMRRVLEMRYGKAGTAEVVLSDGCVVPVSRRHRNRVAEVLRRTLSSGGA